HVVELTADDVRWLYELRAALEIEAAHLALERNGGGAAAAAPARHSRRSRRGAPCRCPCTRPSRRSPPRARATTRPGARSTRRTPRCTRRSCARRGVRASPP